MESCQDFKLHLSSVHVGEHERAKFQLFENDEYRADTGRRKTRPRTVLWD